MSRKTSTHTSSVSNRLLEIGLSLPWLDIVAGTWKLARQLWRGMADEGMYEVLEHESTIELLDRKGQRAVFRKRQKVRYLQNHIIAFQDHAWGDGDILLDYRCTPGIVVDKYRPGNKTLLLISLRETKQRGDVDEFNIEWGIRKGFVRSQELWETEIQHKTKRFRIKVIFPKSRPPRRGWVVEQLRGRQFELEQEHRTELPDGRWALSWYKDKPRLNERYQLHWQW